MVKFSISRNGSGLCQMSNLDRNVHLLPVLGQLNSLKNVTSVNSKQFFEKVMKVEETISGLLEPEIHSNDFSVS